MANRTDPGKMSVVELISRMRVAQLWAVLVIVGGLLAGSFSIGYKLSSTVSGVHASEIDELRLKDRFLSLYLRYELAKDRVARTDPGDETFREAEAALDTTGTALNDFVRERVDASELVLGKGEHRLATIQFADGTVWTIPVELHIAARER